MIDKLMFVQSNKATDHSMAYADSDSSNVTLHVWTIEVLGGLHLSYLHSSKHASVSSLQHHLEMVSGHFLSSLNVLMSNINSDPQLLNMWSF